MISITLPMIGTLLAQATQPAEISSNILQFMGQMGGALALGLGAVGSAIGIGAAGRAAAGAWAKEAKAGKNLSFTYIILLGLPTTQTFYAMIVMNEIGKILMKTTGETSVANGALTTEFAGVLLAVGIGVGIAEMFSAWMQGKIGAAGIRAMCESDGKGFAFFLIAMTIAETIGVLAMVFMLGLIPKVG